VCWSLGFGSLRKRPAYFRSISVRSPRTTGRAVSSSSRSISNSPNSRVSGDPELTDPLGAVEVGEAQDVEELGACRLWLGPFRADDLSQRPASRCKRTKG
jgi:hypothetical protein